MITRLRWIYDSWDDQSWSLYAMVDGHWKRLTTGYFCHRRPTEADAQRVAQRLSRFYPWLMNARVAA